MVLSTILARFSKFSPVAVMARALMEQALEPSALDAIFRNQAKRQYEKELMFSTLVDVMALVVCGVHPSVRTAYQAMREEIPVTLTALYAKLNGVEVATSEALVAASADRLQPVLDALGGLNERWLPGYRIKALDGNHFASTERRLEVLRDCAAGPLPGQALVVMDCETGLATQMVGCEDGHAQERSLLAAVLMAVQPNDVYIADRNFCTLDFLLSLAAQRGYFVIRKHAQLPLVSGGTLRQEGRTDSGKLVEQSVTLRLNERDLVIRRIVVHLDTPTREGDTELVLLTNLPATVADAAAIAALYRRRWTIESLFARVERNLQSELATLAYPGAALLGFAVALVASNVFAVVHSAMDHAKRAHRDEKVVTMPLSDFAIVEEIRTVYRGLTIAVDEQDWSLFQLMPPNQLATLLLTWGQHIKWAQFRKATRGPRGPKKKRTQFTDTPHVSTARLLRKSSSPKTP